MSKIVASYLFNCGECDRLVEEFGLNDKYKYFEGDQL